MRKIMLMAILVGIIYCLGNLTVDAYAPPVVTTEPATNVTSNAATLNGKVTFGTAGITIYLEYGLAITYGNIALIQNVPYYLPHQTMDLSYRIEGLLPDTTYNFRWKATDLVGTYCSADQTFTTLPLKTGDLNDDGVVDMRDIATVAHAFGTHGLLEDGTPASPLWNPIADLNGDNKVDIRDICFIARNYR
jgi:hypothetical protein